MQSIYHVILSAMLSLSPRVILNKVKDLSKTQRFTLNRSFDRLRMTWGESIRTTWGVAFITKSLVLAIILLITSTASPAQSIKFEEVSEQAGIHTAGGSHGIAVHDYDDDGWDDFFIAAGEGRSVLFHNNGDDTFSDVTTVAGVSVAGNAVNPVWGDVNNDGYADLFVGTRGSDESSKLFLNEGNRGFRDVSETSGLNLNASIGSAAFGDYDGDGRLDLFLATRDTPDILYKNTGRMDTLFVNDTSISGVSGSSFAIAMQATWNDFDRDGDLDLFAVHDGNLRSRFYTQGPGYPRFSEISTTAKLQVARSSMGVSWGDYNNDGWPDVYITNIDQGNLFQNLGDGTFLDVTEQTGTGLNGMSWGVVFADFDNDGDEDLFIGNTYGFDGRKSFLYENQNGLFVNIADQAGAALSTNTFGVAAGDFNRDGLMDLIVADEDGKNKLLINRTEQPGNWLALRLRGHMSNTMAVGASVQFTVDGEQFYRTISGGGSFCSQISSMIHVGIGEAAYIDSLVINWGPGREQVFTNIEANKIYELEEGAFIKVGTEKDAVREPVAFLEQNYPNPFVAKTTIAFTLIKTQPVSLIVYDVLGREIDTLKEGVLAAGRHTIVIDLHHKSAGIYFYKMITPSGQQVQAMLNVE